MVISTRVTLDLRLAHTPGGVIRLLPSQTGARGCHLVGDIALAGVACPLRVGSYPPLASGSSISCLRGNQRLDGGRSKQLPYSGLNRWWRWQEINTVSFLHFTNIISIWAKNRFNTFSNIRSKKKKKRALLCIVARCLIYFSFHYIFFQKYLEQHTACNPPAICSHPAVWEDVLILSWNTEYCSSLF